MAGLTTTGHPGRPRAGHVAWKVERGNRSCVQAQGLPLKQSVTRWVFTSTL